ncbi:glycogen debranching protein [Mucilaginibacter sp. McL0603]|uniref:alpha-L-rhamnosidase-related protein n=1 Tax=Mucilaginibacter sp. McL0603 TaxID=3415670 RepID=UPI003CEB99B3
MRFSHFSIFGLLLISGSAMAQNDKPIYNSKVYSIYPDRVVQGKYTAKAVSTTELTSDYRSPANMYKSPVVEFKFSINGKDNEMVSGVNHHYVCSDQSNETPLIQFGKVNTETKSANEGIYLKPSTQFKIRLDMRAVLKEFKDQGYYTCFNGDKIYKNDFKGVFVAGNTAPMIWDFNNLVNHAELELKDPDGDGIYETTLILNKPEDENKLASSWKLSRDVSAFPQYHSTYKISDAIYNLALEEMQKAVEPDSTFRTGKEWGGVWTRDISYSIILSMAILQPKVAVYSLLKKVKDGRIIQDTGTGGAYPCSSDRMIWAVAAWEVYKVTGDKDWLTKAYQIIKKSAEDDVLNVYDKQTGLVRGESSFLDWREETYPKWMQPADIYESECLGTNVVHYQVNKVLAAMSAVFNDHAAVTKYTQRADIIKKGIQENLWIPTKGYYGQYLYGRNFKMLSLRSEALGEALAILFDAVDAEKQQSVISNTPVNAFGIPCIYPQIPGILPYHNNAVWPFVETYWAMASAKAGNEESLIRAISAIYRPAALFLTNKENFVATDGDYAGTQINSSNMLWSLSGNIALVYRVLFGIHYNENSLEFKPFVPKALAGDRSLEHYKYRNAILNISMQGFGNKIKSMTLDGKPVTNHRIPADLKDGHAIKIILADNILTGKSNMAPNYVAPETPVVIYKKGKISWEKASRGTAYNVIKNGKKIASINGLIFPVNTNEYAEYQVASVDAKGISSFNSEPLETIPAKAVNIIQAESIADPSELPYQGFSGKGFVEISKTKNTTLTITVDIKEDGIYAIDFKYANGNGPINTENKCAIRTLDVDEHFAGTLVFPQRGKGEWSNWGFSNSVKVKLSKGKHVVTLQFKDANENMNGDINQAMIDYLRMIKLPGSV